MKEKILRKVDATESYFINGKDLNHVCRLFKLETQLDYYQHLDALKETINKWIHLHPLLDAKIERIGSELFFVETEDKSLKNVHFLRVESDSLSKDIEKYDEIVDLILENETFTMLESTHRLWRLTFLKLSKNEFDYDVIFSIHHAITEGRNVYFIFQQLLDMFEQTLAQKLTNIKPHSILPSMEELFLRKMNASNEKGGSVSAIKMPSFITDSTIGKAKMDSNEQTQLKYSKYTDCIIYSLNENKNLSIDDLIQRAKLSQTKFKFITFNENDSLKLIKKLKEKKIKMQAFINVLFSMAFKTLYNDLGDLSERNHTVVHSHAISLRQFAADLSQFGQSINDNMGFFANTFWYSCTDEITFENFWDIAQKQTVTLHEKLKSGQQFKSPNYLNFDPTKPFSDFELSNLGVFSASFNSTSQHKIKSCFINVRSEAPIRLCFNNFITINNLFFWSFVYNSYVIHQDLADKMSQTVIDLFQKLID